MTDKMNIKITNVEKIKCNLELAILLSIFEAEPENPAQNSA